jgi:uncharacterized protein (DUF58 family)
MIPAMRTALRPTPACMTLGIVVLAVALGAVNYRSNAAYLVLALVLAVALVSALHAWRNLGGVLVVPGGTGPAFAGDALPAQVTLVNRGAGPVWALEVYIPDDDGGEGDGERVAQVAGGASLTIDLALPARSRGLHALSRLRVATVFPLGLFRVWREVPVAWTWLVYPRPLALPPAPASAADDLGGGDGTRLGSGDFHGHRAYRAGDPQRHVDWKAAARGRPLLIKQFAGGVADRWLDWDATSGDVEARLSHLAAEVLAAERAGGSYGLRLGGQSIAQARGPAHVHTCLGALALYPGE